MPHFVIFCIISLATTLCCGQSGNSLPSDAIIISQNDCDSLISAEYHDARSNGWIRAIPRLKGFLKDAKQMPDTALMSNMVCNVWCLPVVENGEMQLVCSNEWDVLILSNAEAICYYEGVNWLIAKELQKRGSNAWSVLVAHGDDHRRLFQGQVYGLTVSGLCAYLLLEISGTNVPVSPWWTEREFVIDGTNVLIRNVGGRGIRPHQSPVWWTEGEVLMYSKPDDWR